MRYFLDTNTCIYYLKGQYPKLLRRLMSRPPEEIKIPAVVKAELLYGAEKSRLRDRNLEMVRAFLLPFEGVPFGDQEAEAYGKIRAEQERKGNAVGPNDLLIAATVLAGGGALVTNNEKEFRRISGLRVENWTR